MQPSRRPARIRHRRRLDEALPRRLGVARRHHRGGAGAARYDGTAYLHRRQVRLSARLFRRSVAAGAGSGRRRDARHRADGDEVLPVQLLYPVGQRCRAAAGCARGRSARRDRKHRRPHRAGCHAAGMRADRAEASTAGDDRRAVQRAIQRRPRPGQEARLLRRFHTSRVHCPRDRASDGPGHMSRRSRSGRAVSGGMARARGDHACRRPHACRCYPVRQG